jgi:F420-dependent oxidoreductase-like protein
MQESLRLPSPCLLVLAGPGASGKSTWASTNFPPEVVVSSDHLRAMVGSAEDDIAASEDALGLLDVIVERRLSRCLTTVVDTLGFDADRRLKWLSAARRAGLPCFAVVFDTPPDECRRRNRSRPKAIPASVLTSQLRTWRRVREEFATEGFDMVLPAEQSVRAVPKAFVGTEEPARRQAQQPVGLRFGVHLGSFRFPGGAKMARSELRRIAGLVEAAGFDAIYVMDHFRQIPQVGRPWEDFLESYTTLAYLAACTETVRLGALVTGITYRNVAHLGKIVATLDVLSGGRAVCGLGAAWHRDEHRAYGWDFPPIGERYQRLEDGLRLLPLLWGPGSPSYSGEQVTVPEAMCYPRPLQGHIPIVVGGGGERRTLRLAARYADMANVMGDRDAVRRKAAVLRAHCQQEGREPDAVELTHLAPALVGAHDRHVAELVGRYRVRRAAPGQTAAALNAGTVDDHVGRFRQLADDGVREVTLRLPDPGDPDQIQQLATVIAAFR